MDAKPGESGPAGAGGARSRTFVTAFARGLAVIQAFGPDRRRMSLAEVAAATGLDRAVARRLLLTLVDLGFAAGDGKQFELTPGLLRLGYSYLASLGLGGALQPQLDELSREIAESVSVSVLDHDTVVFVARSDSAGRRMTYAVTNGTRMPAFTSAAGRMLLSSLPDERVAALLKTAEIRKYTRYTVVDPERLLGMIRRARADGYTINEQELDEGLLSVAVLLTSRTGRAVASLNASSHVGRMKRQALVREIVPRLKAFADRVSGMLL